MAMAERHQHVGVARPSRAVVEVGQGNSTAGDADVVEDAGEFRGGNLLANDGFDSVHEARGFFDARAGTGAQMQPELTRVHGGEEILSQPGYKQGRPCAKEQEQRGKGFAMMQHCAKPPAIAFAKSREPALKPTLESGKWAQPQRNRSSILRVPATLMLAVEPHRQCGHEGSRKNPACQHSKDNRLGQRHEQISRDAREEEHRHENNRDAQGRHKRRQRNFL